MAENEQTLDVNQNVSDAHVSNGSGAPEAPVQVDTKDESAASPADTAAKDPQEKPRGGFQKRIDRLTRENEQAWNVANRALALLEENKKPNVPADAEPQVGQFKTYEEYTAAVARQAARQESQRVSKETTEQVEQRAAELENQRQREEFRGRLGRDGKGIEGFGEVLETIFDDDSFPISVVMADFLRDTDHPAPLAKWLVENEDEAHRIARLRPIAAAKELVRVEAALAKAPPRTTKAPAPPPSVQGAGGVASSNIERMSHTDLKDLVRKWGRA